MPEPGGGQAGENGSVKGAASGKGVDEVAAAAGIGGRIGKPSSDKRLQNAETKTDGLRKVNNEGYAVRVESA